MQETVLLMEDILIDYITDTVHKAQDVASRRGKLTTEDIMFLVRKDARKFARVKELLAMNEELKRARKAFEVDEDKLANDY
jgi:transcription initiation factor TFIID subunit 13